MATDFQLEPPTLKERDVVTQCVNVLNHLGIFPHRYQSGFFRTKDGRGITIGEPGIPDWVVPAWWLEVKAPGKRPTPEQLMKHMQLERSEDALVAVIDSKQALIEWLRAHPELVPEHNRRLLRVFAER